ncbi:MAG: hypothetical protein QMC95_16915 [Desulfitobacteriaceae bacterium]|nr:hypothetical protein [Desulfitobacteriaceae bacterium]MDI6915869.1 hypothetical protein [Desulfitobacteriaceae bacterium]
MSLCEICKTNAVRVHLTISEEKTLHICMECNNNLTAEFMGIDLEPFEPGIYEFSGVRCNKHKFDIERNVNPMGIGYEASEVTEDGRPGFRVAVMDSVDCNQQLLLEKLKAKIKTTIFKRYLKTEMSPYTGKQIIIKKNEVAGRLEYNDENDKFPKLVIDGQEFSWEELGRMLNSYEGFQFQLKVFDITDDIE